jgi:hypothetical protein
MVKSRNTPKKIVRCKSRKQRFSITVECQPMLVDYTPNWMRETGMFEFRSPHKPARRIPVSETGYRSHFADMSDIEEATSPEEYARDVALAFIRQASPKSFRVAESVQPSLLSLLD